MTVLEPSQVQGTSHLCSSLSCSASGTFHYFWWASNVKCQKFQGSLKSPSVGQFLCVGQWGVLLWGAKSVPESPLISWLLVDKPTLKQTSPLGLESGSPLKGQLPPIPRPFRHLPDSAMALHPMCPQVCQVCSACGR